MNVLDLPAILFLDHFLDPITGVTSDKFSRIVVDVVGWATIYTLVTSTREERKKVFKWK